VSKTLISAKNTEAKERPPITATKNGPAIPSGMLDYHMEIAGCGDFFLHLLQVHLKGCESRLLL